MAFGYPVMLELRSRRCVVIGQQAVRERKVEGLIEGGADRVVVISAEPAERLDRLQEEHGAVLRIERRSWRPEDLDGTFLVVASDPSGAARDRIANEARRRGALVNVMDDVPNCDWAAPALVRRGDLVLAIATGGRSPTLARRLRERVGDEFGPEWTDLVSILGEVRELTFDDFADVGERARAWAGSLDVDEAAALVREGRGDVLRDRLIARLRDAEARSVRA